MKAKFQIDDNGEGYVALIDPSTKEHKKSATLSKGQEVTLTMPGVTDASEVEFSDVAVSESATQTGEPAPPEDGAPADGDQGGEPAPTTSAASEKPLYLVEGDTVPDGFTLSGLETPDGKTLYHFAGDTAGQQSTGNVDSVSVYAEADDNEQPVQAAAPTS